MTNIFDNTLTSLRLSRKDKVEEGHSGNKLENDSVLCLTTEEKTEVGVDTQKMSFSLSCVSPFKRDVVSDCLF